MNQGNQDYWTSTIKKIGKLLAMRNQSSCQKSNLDINVGADLYFGMKPIGWKWTSKIKGKWLKVLHNITVKIAKTKITANMKTSQKPTKNNQICKFNKTLFVLQDV